MNNTRTNRTTNNNRPTTSLIWGRGEGGFGVPTVAIAEEREGRVVVGTFGKNVTQPEWKIRREGPIHRSAGSGGG